MLRRGLFLLNEILSMCDLCTILEIVPRLKLLRHRERCFSCLLFINRPNADSQPVVFVEQVHLVPTQVFFSYPFPELKLQDPSGDCLVHA